MKKLLSTVLVIAAVIALLFSLTSCDNDGYTDYVDYNLKFRLPDEFVKRSMMAYEIIFTTPSYDAEFNVVAMSKDEIEDPDMEFEFDFSITVEEYAEFMIWYNDLDCDYVYDEERDVATIELDWTPNEEAGHVYNYITILKNDAALYVAMYACNYDVAETYAPIFREYAKVIELVS